MTSLVISKAHIVLEFCIWHSQFSTFMILSEIRQCVDSYQVLRMEIFATLDKVENVRCSNLASSMHITYQVTKLPVSAL